MRLWSIHPKYMDTRGLVALWREGLLAQSVLKNRTRGYKNHPQLIRFKETDNPVQAIGYYLRIVYREAVKRGFNFNIKKLPVITGKKISKIWVTDLQVSYEWGHFKSKLEKRDRERLDRIKLIDVPEHHPLFKIKKGPVEKWEKI